MSSTANKKDLLKIFLSLKEDFLQLFLIVITDILVWHKTLNQLFLGEGYYYFDHGQNFYTNGGLSTFSQYLIQYDNFARLIFDVLPPIFKDNILYYQIFQLATFTIFSLVVYYFAKSFSKNKWLSLITTIIFSVSYSGVFEILAIGNYQRFVQRVPNFIFFFISLIWLKKFFDTKKISHYFISLLVFIFTVFMSHYSTFLTPVIPSLTIAYAILSKQGSNILSTIKSIFKNVIIILPFLLFNYLIIKSDHFNPENGLVSTHFVVKDIVQQLLLQFSHMTYPATVIQKIATISQPSTTIVTAIAIPIIILFIVGFFLVKRKSQELTIIYLTSLLVIPAILFLNVYIGKIDFLSLERADRYYFVPFGVMEKLNIGNIGGNRYYYLPTIFTSIIWGILLYTLTTKKKIYQLFTIIILSTYVFYNANLIWTEIDKTQPISDRMNTYLTYIKSISNEVKNKSVIVAPAEFIWAGQVVREFHGNPDLKFIPTKDLQEAVVSTKKENILILDYDNSNNQVIKLEPDIYYK